MNDPQVVAVDAKTFGSAPLASFVESARRASAIRGIQWAATEWELSASDPVVARARMHRTRSRTLCFSTRESSCRGKSRVPANERNSMAWPFIELAKAFLADSMERRTVTIEVLRRELTALQFLEQAFRNTGLSAPSALSLVHFEEAESEIERQLSSSTAYRVSVALERFGKLIDQRQLTDFPIGYTSRQKRPLDGDELTDEGQAIGLAKMVSPEVLDALAAVSCNPADDRERLTIRIVDLLVAGGFRIGELLSLPANCWITESSPSGRRDPKTGAPLSSHGILYVAEKARDYRVKWLPAQCVELAERAVKELSQHCRKAREMAHWLESNPGRLKPLSDFATHDLIAGADAALRLGFSAHSHRNWKLPSSGRGENTKYRVGDIERYFRRRCREAPLVKLPSGKKQLVSESLIVLWEHESHRSRPTSSFMVRPCTVAQLSVMLAPAPSQVETSGILSRFKLRVTPKQIRHWLNTIAANSGLSDTMLAQWMGRKDLRQNLAYKHGTLKERVDAAKRLILDGKAIGSVSRILSRLPRAEWNDYLNGAVEAAHVTPFGLCLHNFASAPCPNHNECLRGCGEYHRVKGDIEQRTALLTLKDKEEVNLHRAQLALTNGFVGADRWVESSREILAGIQGALAVDDEPDQPALGQLALVFPGSPSKALLP